MAELPPLHQAIILDASGVPAAVAETTAGLEAIGVAAEGTAVELTAARGAMAGLFKGAVVIAGIMALVHELKAAKDEAASFQEATLNLNTVLDNNKSLSKEDAESARERTEAYTQLGFAHSDSTQAMANLVTASGSVSQANKLMAVSADYARYKHISLTEASTIMARATQGNAKAFKAMGISLDTTLPKNQAIAKAFNELNARIGGTAKNSVGSFSVQLKIMEEKFQSLVNKIANAVMPILTFLINALGKAADWIKQNSSFLKIYGGVLLVIVGYLKAIALWEAIVDAENPFYLIAAAVVAVGVALAWVWNHSTIFRETMAETLATIVQLVGYVVGAFAKLARVLSNVPGFGFLKGVADGADKVAISIGKAAKAVDDLKNKKVSIPKIPKLDDFVKPGSNTGITGNVTGGDATKGGGAGSQTIQYVTVYASDTNDIAKKLAKGAKVGIPIGKK